MRNDRNLILGSDASGTSTQTGILSLSPFIGLVYIIILPLVGLASLVLLGAYRTKLALGSIRH